MAQFHCHFHLSVVSSPSIAVAACVSAAERRGLYLDDVASYDSTGLPPVLFVGPDHSAEFLSAVEKPPPKRQKRRTESGLGHLLSPKTLCNACGVRFKSSRLYHEYRPACSPTFSLKMHSNSHQKVLEIRLKKKEPRSSWVVHAQTVGSFE